MAAGSRSYVEGSVALEFWCKDCGNAMCGNVEVEAQGDNTYKIRLVPCEYCVAQANAEGASEKDQELQKRISELQERIDELDEQLDNATV